jgi:hypothetical protein
MATSFCWVETLGTLDGDLLNLSNLANEFLSFPQLMCVFIFPSLESFVNLSLDFITDFFIRLVFESHLLASIVLLGVNLSDDSLFILEELLLVVSSFV